MAYENIWKFKGEWTMSKKANVLFFLTDDQRFDTISALGNPEIKLLI